MLIRAATDDDWPVIWAFMRGILAAGETYTYDRDLSSDEARSLWVMDSSGRTVVAVDDDGSVVGTAKMGPNQGGPGAHVATASFMVDPKAARRGVGRALGRYAIEWATDQGFRAMQFNAVVETNTRAVQLWRSLGFEVLATVPAAFYHPTHGYVGLLVMFRRLGPASSGGPSPQSRQETSMDRPRTTLTATVLDAPDPRALAAFYRELLGWELQTDEPDWVKIGAPGGGPGLSFQTEAAYARPAWPAGPGDQQMMTHLDIEVADLDAGVAYAVRLGAVLADFQPQADVRVCLDPVGHPFCLWVRE